MAETKFREHHVDADGFTIRYLEAGDGAPLVHLHGAGGLRLTPAHELLARRFRVVAFEMPGFGTSPVNTRTESMPELASTMARAIDKLGLDTFNLMGTSFGGKTALWLALQQTGRVLALVLEAPAAIRQEGPTRSRGDCTRTRSACRRLRSIRRCVRRRSRWSSGFSGRTATPTSKVGYRISRRPPWCCSARSTA